MPYYNTGFSDCLRQMMERRGLSVSELARLLNLKSKTTIARILRNDAGERSILSFRNLLANSRELALTGEELQKLDESMSVRTRETAHSVVFEELWALLCDREIPSEEIRVLGSDRFADLSDFGEKLADTDLECIVINCGFHSLLRSLERAFDRTDGRKVTISQYFYNSGTYPRRIVQTIGRILPLLSRDCYMAYTISQDSADGCFDLHAAAVRCGTGEEYELLFYLIKNKNIALSRDKLLSDIWGYDFFGDDRTIDTHIKNLRNNLGPYRDYIVTLRGVGYKFEYEEE